MNRIEISTEGVEPPLWLERTAPFAQAVLEKRGKRNWDLSLLFCDNKTITKLNKQYRSKDEATDVLSFSLNEFKGERFLPGDIAISLDMLKENALRFNVTDDEELRRLLIHGILHLEGMDHSTNDTNEPMLILQEDILKELGEYTIIDKEVYK